MTFKVAQIKMTYFAFLVKNEEPFLWVLTNSIGGSILLAVPEILYPSHSRRRAQ